MHTTVLEALGELDQRREAIDNLEPYQQFRPKYSNCRDINRQSPAASINMARRRGIMKPTVQAVTITDDGPEFTRKVSYIER